MFASPGYSTCPRRVLGIPEAGEAPEGDPGVPGAQGLHLVELWSSCHPQNPTGTPVHPPGQGQPRHSEIQDSLSCNQRARSRNGLGMSAVSVNPLRGETDPGRGQREGPSPWESLMGLRGTGAPVNTERRRRESPPWKDFRVDFRDLKHDSSNKDILQLKTANNYFANKPVGKKIT